MFVRQSIIIVLILLITSAHKAASQEIENINIEITTEIEELNERLQNYLEEEDFQELIKLYKDDAYLLIPGKTYNGQKEIIGYWQEIGNPVEWQLEAVDVVPREREIYSNAYYQALENKPAGWRQRGIELDEDEPLIYQLGRVKVKLEGDNGKIKPHEAANIKIWQVQPDGTYKILIDSYSWK
ncbi:MAG: hypothetical protein ACNS60_08735 [Candidatus Cyclobacteriaceae bacterium M2_1C_046]